MAIADDQDLRTYCEDVARRAKAASAALATVTGQQKNDWLNESAAALRENLADFPGHLPSMLALMELEFAGGNGGAVIDLSRRLLEVDHRRQQLGLVRGLFEQVSE